jgi:hypothetical protein
MAEVDFLTDAIITHKITIPCEINNSAEDNSFQ